MDSLTIQTIFSNLGVNHSIILDWSNEYANNLDKFEINTKYRVASFFANIMLESSKLSRLEENLNYSASRLAQVFPATCSNEGYRSHTKTPNKRALAIAHNPKLTASFIYGSRMGNGPESTHDGYTYRGRGPIQITGKDNYRRLAHDTDLDCLNNPDELLTTHGGVVSSCWYYRVTNCGQYADKNDFDGVRDLVNKGRKTAAIGDSLGYQEAFKYYKEILSILG